MRFFFLDIVLLNMNFLRFIWPIDDTLIGKSEPKSSGNKGVLDTAEVSRFRFSPADAV